LTFSEILHRARAVFAVTFHIVVVLAVGMVVLNAGVLAYAPGLFWVSAIYAVVAGTYLIILFHHRALRPDQPDALSAADVAALFWPFLWRSMALGLGAGVSAGIVIGLLSLFGQAGLSVAALIITPVIFIIVGLFGSVFPAIVDGGDRSWRAAFERAEARIWPILWMFIKGPFFVALLVQVIFMAAAFAGLSIMLVTPEGGVSVIAAILSFAAAMAQHFVSAMAVVILCHIYQTDAAT